MIKDKPHLFERLFVSMLPFDHFNILYCWIILVLTIGFARPIGDFYGVLLFHTGALVLVILIVKFLGNKTSRGAVFFRLLYPVMLMTFYYTFSGKLVLLFTHHFLDYQITAFELSLFGLNPTLWLDGHMSKWVTELLSIGYFSYYFMIPGLALVLFFQKRDKMIKRYITASCATFFTSYLIFILYPVEGPRHFFAHLYQHVPEGYVFRGLVDFVIGNAAFHGGAMPSSHVAEALVVMFFALRVFRKKALFVVPFVFLLALGTVWGRFHYVSDVVVGITIGILATWLTFVFYPIEDEDARERRRAEMDIRRRYVSNNI